MDHFVFVFLAEVLDFYDLLLKKAHAFLSRTGKVAGYRLTFSKKENRFRLRETTTGSRRSIPSAETSPAMIRAVQSRHILQNIVRLCEHNIRVLQNCLEALEPIELPQLLSRLPEAYRCEPSVIQEALGWIDGRELLRTDPNFHPEGRKVPTRSGIFVRSKSEMIIADALFALGIRFVFEPCILLNGTSYHPDFVLYLPITGRMVIWEHFGRMDDPDYQWKTIRKLQDYFASGYLPGINLITTYENKDHVFSSRDADSIIGQWIRRA